MELDLFRAINALATRGPLWEWVIVFCASYLQYIVCGAVVVLALRRPRRIRMALAAFSAALIARFGVAEAMYAVVPRARPFVTLSDVTELVHPLVRESMHAMPSGHTTFFFAFATVVWMHDRRLGIATFAGASLIALARIAAGVHWPGDILAGIVIGSGVGWLCVRFIPAFRRHTRRR